MSQAKPKTLLDLKNSGYQSRTVKDEMRHNLQTRLAEGKDIFPGIIGYEKTVLPQIENAILSGHNFILLGLRGQAKSRMIRQLANLLDDQLPYIPGTLLNEDPLNPISPMGKRLVAEQGDKLEIGWMNREARYHEKLATPDVSIADLIGDIDPIKAAREKLDISNEEVIHWGIIPRTNRGIFAINELPDLQPRIQVGLLNILEENDIQVRGFPLRIPLDLLLVFTANPEDYTNRGNIITPLKDRIDAQIVTHYPRSVEMAKKITAGEVVVAFDPPTMPEFIRDIIEEVSFQARKSEYVDQTSGVSARVSISAYESLLSNIKRRKLRSSDTDYYPRICDIYSITSAVSGKIELVYEGEQEGATIVTQNLIGEAINSVFEKHFPRPLKGKVSPDEAPPDNPYEAVIDYFSSGKKLEISDDMPYETYRDALRSIAGLKEIVQEYFPVKDEREELLRMELVLEGLHYNNVIARETHDSIIQYGDIFSDMLKGMEGMA